jgi:hypothetical protein
LASNPLNGPAGAVAGTGWRTPEYNAKAQRENAETQRNQEGIDGDLSSNLQFFAVFASSLRLCEKSPERSGRGGRWNRLEDTGVSRKGAKGNAETQRKRGGIDRVVNHQFPILCGLCVLFARNPLNGPAGAVAGTGWRTPEFHTKPQRGNAETQRNQEGIDEDLNNDLQFFAGFASSLRLCEKSPERSGRGGLRSADPPY